jgi:hypothetical protein
MHSWLITGSIPGMAASTRETCEFGSPPKAVEAPEKSFDCEVTWAWTSSPMTTSQSPVALLMSFDGLPWTFIAGAFAWRWRITTMMRSYNIGAGGTRT